MRANVAVTLAAILASLLVLSISSRASANVAVVRREGAPAAATNAAPRFPRESGVVLEDVAVTYDCAFDRDELLACAVEERLRLFNPGAQREDLVGSVLDYDNLEEPAITVDGGSVTQELAAEDHLAIDAAAVAVSADFNGFDLESTLDRISHYGFALVVEPGSRRELVIVGRVRQSGIRFDHGDDVLVMPAVRARHLMLSSDPQRQLRYELELVTSFLRTFQGTPSGRMRVVHPASMSLDSAAPSIAGESPGAGRAVDTIDLRLQEGARERADAEAKGAIDHSTWHEAFALVEDAPLIPLQNGGVLFGLGGATGDTRGFRMKVGYEVAAPEFMLYQLAIESNLGNRTFIVPSVEAASPQIYFIFASLGLGLGVPIQVRPDTRVGARLQLDYHFFAVGFVAAFDLFPGTSNSTHFTQATFLGEIAL